MLEETRQAIAAERRTVVAAVSLALNRTRPDVVAPITSTRTPGQLADLLSVASLRLTDDEVATPNSASASI